MLVGNAKDKTKDEAEKEIKEEMDGIFQDASLGYCGNAAEATVSTLFKQTVGYAIDCWGPVQWTHPETQAYIRRHVRIIARVATSLARAAGADCVSKEDIDDATKIVIDRARRACGVGKDPCDDKKDQKAFNDEYNKASEKGKIRIKGRPCAGL